MLKFLLILFLAASCTITPNNFTAEANVFLDVLGGSVYNGTGASSGAEFRSSGVIFSTKDAPTTSAFQDRRALKFQNTRNNGVSETEGIYMQEKTPDIPTFPPPPAGETVRYVGIVRQDNKLLHTPFIDKSAYANNPENLNWTSLTEFAMK